MKKLGFIAIICLLVTSGCSLTGNTIAENSNELTKKKVATNINDILKEGPGKLAGENLEDAKLVQEIKNLPSGLTTNQSYSALISLLAEDYQPIDKEIDKFDPTIKVGTTKPGGVQSPPSAPSEELNVSILLDASGSMAEKIGGKSKMDIAKESIKEFASSLPKETKLSLRIYGHKGSNSKQDKAESCKSNEEVYSLANYESSSFQKALNKFKPTGWTPLAAAIKATEEGINHRQSARQVVYVVSDGLETCGGNPAQAAKNLHTSGVEAIVNIIGFDVDDKGQSALKKVADAGGGKYGTAQSEQDLSEYFTEEYQRLREQWKIWKKKSETSVDNSDTVNQDKLYKLIYKDALGLQSREKDRLNQAIKLMDKANKTKNILELQQKIAERENKIKSYFIDRDNKIEPLLIQEENKKLNEIEETEKSEQDKLNQKIENAN
ncbi:VWA domain-containing protein [Marininema halotolerans]|uniref:D-amino-acid dehydrogenase/Ca-activated chloride channel family protein n=1 Tax=Marininema halotolerans TaxID=1155944 RepID=A0A1I6RJ42_9BACL|nr:VWA domain-containing protein [Marininema halotolerans]SFS64773.1 D-amino-acid dehydrogenase/Ca-activated chloride channel family protein [Marininema halotolerans]